MAEGAAFAAKNVAVVTARLVARPASAPVIHLKRLDAQLAIGVFKRQGALFDPGGQFALDLNRDAPVVLIGGGVGVTPVLMKLLT